MALGHIEVCTCTECVAERASRPQAPAAHVTHVENSGKTARQIEHERRVREGDWAPGGTEPPTQGAAVVAHPDVASAVEPSRGGRYQDRVPDAASSLEAVPALWEAWRCTMIALEFARGEGAPPMSAVEVLELAVGVARSGGRLP